MKIHLLVAASFAVVLGATVTFGQQQNVINSTGPVGIGVTTNLSTSLTVGRNLELDTYTDGTSTSWALVQGYDRSSSPGARPMWLEASKFFFSSGNVGIGTTTPSAALHVLRDMGSSVTAIARFRNTNSTAKTTRIQLEDSAGSVGDGLIDYVHSDASTANHYLGLGLNSSAQLVLRNGGNVGIGTTSPDFPLQVSRSAADQYLGWFENTQSSPGGARLRVQNTATQGSFEIDVNSDGNTLFQTGKSANSPSLSILSGNVGIGKTDPGYKLDVNGTINSNSTITANNIVAKYQDVAEWVPSSEQLSAGTVVVLDSTKSNQVTSSLVSYDTRVAGVVSEQPGIALGEKGDSKVLVATTGRVKVKVDASKGPIHIGDLLVTSDVPGMAMKSEPMIIRGRQIHAPGTLIGKALEPLDKGKGSILVLLSLQ